MVQVDAAFAGVLLGNLLFRGAQDRLPVRALRDTKEGVVRFGFYLLLFLSSIVAWRTEWRALRDCDSRRGEFPFVEN